MFTLESLQQCPSAVKAFTGLPAEEFWRLVGAVGERLQACARAEDTLARPGGDEFVLLLEDVADVGEARLVAARLAEALARPMYRAKAGGKAACDVFYPGMHAAPAPQA